MKRETIWQVSVVTSAEAEEAVAELLAAQFAPSPSSYTDVETGRVTVSAYATKSPTNRAALGRALRSSLKEIKACGLNVAPGKITIHKLPRENWAESWKRHFKAIEIGSRLLVKPSWIHRQPKRGQAVIVLDPGLSFGTGQHPTTEFCLEQIVRRQILPERGRSPSAARAVQPGPQNIAPDIASVAAATGDRSRSLLDIGTGSGILAIAAAKLGYASVDAFDYDPQAVLVARENARRNRVADQIKIFRADLTRLPRRSAKQYDVVCANLLANLLIAERDRILARVQPDGVLVIAGILKREFTEVLRTYAAAGWRLVASRARKEWRSGALMQKAQRG
jgi:ribosomal protein L11 methyltransferase